MKSSALARSSSSRLLMRLVTVFILAALIVLPCSETASASTLPSITIISVNVDSSVKVQFNNFPANITFVARMGAYGTAGQEITQFGSGEGGTFYATFNIPANLRGLRTLFVRVDGKTGGYYAYNYFTNNASAPVVNPVSPSYTPIPTFSIENVVKDNQVTVKTYNFPKNVNFTVRMGAYGTLGIGGEVVTTFGSGEGGSFNATFNIPASLHGSYRIAIRMDG